jgi:N6-adenosine-specific RNA methylase IME4
MKTQTTSTNKKYEVIYADPPWRYDFSRTKNRDIKNHYPTMALEEIKQLDIPSADNSLLLLWATAPKLIEALEVMEAWGFKYKTNGVWNKEIIGMGYWFRGQHELLLVGTKGKFSPPLPKDRISSVYSERRTKHSKKPDYIRNWIDKAFKGYSKLELFARTQKDSWAVFGNQVKNSIEIESKITDIAYPKAG